jgi:small subunit ribosomal protein S20
LTCRTTPQAESIDEVNVANIKSQIKRIRTNEAARVRNRAVKSELRSVVRSAREAAAGDSDTARDLARVAGRKLDKAASKGVIHKNQAANRKAALFAKLSVK